MKKYLITGVMGFVGRYFVEYLLAHESYAEIIGVDIAPVCDMPIKYQMMDLNDSFAVNAFIQKIKPDYIVHLASISSVGQSWQNPTECFQNNTNIMLNILNAVSQNKLKTRVLSIGSSEEYGNGKMPLNEDMSLEPENPYAVAKVSQELLCKLYSKSLGVEVVMTRSFNHIGPRQNERFVVPSFIRQLVSIAQGAENKMLVGNIDVARDFTDVRDVVEAYYKILRKGRTGEIYNVCTGKAVKLREILNIAEDILGIKANIEVEPSRLRPNDVMLIEGNNEKLRQELGWEPKYSIEQTISDIIVNMQNKQKE